MPKKLLQNWRKNILDKYKVRLYKKAYRDLDSIYRYIAYDKLSTENAKGQVDRIRNAILSLNTFPQSHQDRLVGRYANKGYKQLIVDNYITIFKIDESEKIVWVVTVQYQGRNI